MTELELKKYSRNALLGSFVSMLTAGLATMMYSVCISTIRTDLALTAVQAGSLGTYTFMGQMLGGMVAGYLADRFGRKNILIVDVILATLAVFATSLLQSYSIFGLLRFPCGTSAMSSAAPCRRSRCPASAGAGASASARCPSSSSSS